MASDFRSHIRGEIRPFPRVATYPTSWAGSLTFQQLYDDLVHYVTNVMKGRGIHRTNYLPDWIQHGFMALWLEISENKDFLAQKTRQQAVFFILARCKISTLRYYDDKYDSLEALMSYDWRSSSDEHTITGFSAPSGWWNSVEQWATWATDIGVGWGDEPIKGLVSVALVVYNGTKYLPEAVDSVLAQTYRPIELIVVDDGSTDDTWSLLQSYGDSIVAIHQANGGLPVARNTAIRHARGRVHCANGPRRCLYA